MTKKRQEYIESLYQKIYLIRRVEEEIIRLYPTDKIKSPVHLSIGQESVSVGVCHNLKQDDIVFGTYRGHALYLAKGGNLPRMMSELYGKAGGCGRGKAGSMHLVDAEVGMMGTSAIVGTSIPQAVGYALALKMQKKNAVVTVFFGDGSTDEGVFTESLNFAALKNLPILFVCENNLYAIYSHIRDRMAGPGLCDRVRALGIKATTIPDGDIFQISDESQKAVMEIRSGQGPRFLECMTYRWRDHVGPGEDRVYHYRPDQELDEWIKKDQLSRLAQMIPDQKRAEIETCLEAEIAAAIQFAETDVFPSVEEVNDHVFAQ